MYSIGKLGLNSNLSQRSHLAVLAFIATTWMGVTQACPFCTALPRTLTDNLEESSAAVIGHYESSSEVRTGVDVCCFRVTEVIKGSSSLKGSRVEIATSRVPSQDENFLLIGYGEDIQWAPASSISAAGVAYLRGLKNLPDRGTARLAHFLNYLKHDEATIANDAYNEFAEASLADIKALKARLDRRWVIEQLLDTTVARHQRRLCWTFLSQCGTAADTIYFDRATERHRVDKSYDACMDAAISCYIALGGESALARIERDYLANPDVEYSDAFASIKAIRVHGTDLVLFTRRRLSKSLRIVLNRPALADLVIADLARWRDWSAVDQMVELFESSTQETALLRPAAVLYLKACPLPEATEALDKLRAIDAEAVMSAEASMGLYPGVASIPVPPPDSDDEERRQIKR